MVLEPVRSHELPDVIDFVRPGITEVLKQTRGEFTEASILDGVTAGWLQLWVAFEGEIYLGHVVTKIDQFPNGKQLTIMQVHTVPGGAKGLLKDGMLALEAEAIARGCRWVAVYSQLKHNRAGADWAERMAMLGLKPCYVEYWKEV